MMKIFTILLLFISLSVIGQKDIISIGGDNLRSSILWHKSDSIKNNYHRGWPSDKVHFYFSGDGETTIQNSNSAFYILTDSCGHTILIPASVIEDTKQKEMIRMNYY